MGREAAITYEKVAAAADACKLAGGKPTSRGIRELLGNVGSMGTVNKLLQRWKASHEYQITPALVLPAALQHAILEFMDRESTKIRAALEGELVECQQEAADLATENERQLELLEAQAERSELICAEKASAEGRAVQLAQDLASVREEVALERQVAEMARIELAKAQLKLDALPQLEEAQHTLQRSLEAERVGRVEAEQAAAVLTSQRCDLEARISDWKRQVDRVAEQLVRVQERADRLAACLELERKARIEAEQSAAVLASQKANLEASVLDAKTYAGHLEEQWSRAQQRADQFAAELVCTREMVSTATR